MPEAHTRSLPSRTLSPTKTPLLSHRWSNVKFHPPAPMTSPSPAPSYTSHHTPAPQCLVPPMICHAEIIADNPADNECPTYASTTPSTPETSSTPTHTPSKAPPAYDAPPAIITLQLWQLNRSKGLSPDGTCYLQIATRNPKNKIRLGTRITCIDFRGWGTDEADRIRVAVRKIGEEDGLVIVQFGTTPRSPGVVQDSDTFYIYLQPEFVSESGWGEERGGKNRPWLSRVFERLLSSLHLNPPKSIY